MEDFFRKKRESYLSVVVPAVWVASFGQKVLYYLDLCVWIFAGNSDGVLSVLIPDVEVSVPLHQNLHKVQAGVWDGAKILKESPLVIVDNVWVCSLVQKVLDELESVGLVERGTVEKSFYNKKIINKNFLLLQVKARVSKLVLQIGVCSMEEKKLEDLVSGVLIPAGEEEAGDAKAVTVVGVSAFGEQEADDLDVGILVVEGPPQRVVHLVGSLGEEELDDVEGDVLVGTGVVEGSDVAPVLRVQLRPVLQQQLDGVHPDVGVFASIVQWSPSEKRSSF